MKEIGSQSTIGQSKEASSIRESSFIKVFRKCGREKKNSQERGEEHREKKSVSTPPRMVSQSIRCSQKMYASSRVRTNDL